jgi:hypothetical protein
MLNPMIYCAMFLLNNAIYERPQAKCLTELAGSKETTEVAIEEILDTPYILNPDSIEISPYPRVISFVLSISSKKDVEMLQKNSNRLSTQQFSAIGYANVGDKIYIEHIILSYPDGSNRKIQPLTFIITARTKEKKRLYPGCGTGVN